MTRETIEFGYLQMISWHEGKSAPHHDQDAFYID
jgi:hypothetical protein